MLSPCLNYTIGILIVAVAPLVALQDSHLFMPPAWAVLLDIPSMLRSVCAAMSKCFLYLFPDNDRAATHCAHPTQFSSKAWL